MKDKVIVVGSDNIGDTVKLAQKLQESKVDVVVVEDTLCEKLTTMELVYKKCDHYPLPKIENPHKWRRNRKSYFGR